MPLNSDACVDPGPGCCDSLFTFADYLRCQCLDALAPFFKPGYCDDGFLSYVAQGVGDDGVSDSLIVAVNQMNPSPNTGPNGFSVWIMTFDVRLRESGYPMVAASGGAISPPDPAAQQRATRQLMAHGEAIHRRLSSLKSSRQLAPEGFRCLTGTIGQLIPLNPQGGTAGYSILVNVTMPWS